jgi:hypothetical protein
MNCLWCFKEFEPSISSQKHCSLSCAVHKGGPKPRKVGRRFGKLVAHSYYREEETGKIIYVCECDCGKKDHKIASEGLKSSTGSCGCERARILRNRPLCQACGRRRPGDKCWYCAKGGKPKTDHEPNRRKPTAPRETLRKILELFLTLNAEERCGVQFEQLVRSAIRQPLI